MRGFTPRKRTRDARSTRTVWETINTRCGYLVFGLPAVLAVPALIATLARFGLWDILRSAVPVALCLCVPLLLWLRYTHHRPRSRSGKCAWALVAAAATTTLVISPLFFWVGPVLAVLGSELLRVLLSPRHRVPRRWLPARPPRVTKLSAPPPEG